MSKYICHRFRMGYGYQKSNDFTIYDRGPSPSSIFMWFNQNPGIGEDNQPYVEPHKLQWFRNKFFRQAIMYAFDREAICESVFLGQAEPMNSVINQANPKWNNPNVRQYTHNIEKAKSLLQSQGFNWDDDGQLFDANGNEVAFTFNNYLGSDKIQGIATTFKQNMSDIDTSKIEPVAFSTIIQKITFNFDYEMAIVGWGSSAGATDPHGSKAMYSSM